MQRRAEPIDFRDVANCIKLAHKYDIQDVLDASLAELQLYFPKDFAPWDTSTACSDIEAISAVQLARLTSTPSVLPSALYVCCLLPVNELLQGNVRDDGVVDTLSTEDLSRCIQGKARLCTRMVQITHDLFAPANNPNCTSLKTGCDAVIAAISQREVHALKQGDGAVLERWTDIIDRHCENRHPKPQLPLCRSCIDFLKARQNGIRAQVWSELPKIFDLEVEDGDEDDATSAVTYA